jgi:four helix bundle protein
MLLNLPHYPDQKAANFPYFLFNSRRFHYSDYFLLCELAAVENNIILNKTRQFGACIVDAASAIPISNRISGKQLIRSGTSIGASVAEAQSAETLADFVHKLKIADNEINETYYWLSILEKQIPGFGVQLNADLTEIKKILSSIIIICKRKMKK